MSSIFDCGDEAQLLAGMRHARQAISRGELIVMPTDTVYGCLLYTSPSPRD